MQVTHALLHQVLEIACCIFHILGHLVKLSETQKPSRITNTVIMDRLVLKFLHPETVNIVLCVDQIFCHQPVSIISSSLILNTVTPQGCVLGPFLFTLFIHDCSAIHSSKIISNNDETHNREEIQHLIRWCSTNSLVLNTSNTKEIVNFYGAMVESILSLSCTV